MDPNLVLKPALKSSTTGVTGLANKIRNIEGNLRMPVRNVTLTKPLNDVASQEVPISDEQVHVAATVRNDCNGIHNVSSGWDDSNVHSMKSSFVNIVAAVKDVPPKLNFRTLLSTSHVEKADCVLPVENVIRDNDDVFYFKFTSHSGMERVLEQGPWMIRNQPLILTKWSADGLSLIGTQIGTPILLDAFTSLMCKDPWDRIGYARALIEVSADRELKKEITMAIPIRVSCVEHSLENCPKRVVVSAMESNVEKDDGFTTVKSRKRKGKKVDNGQNKSIDGVRLTKPKANFQYRRVEKGESSLKNVKSTPKDGPEQANASVIINNSFSALTDQDETNNGTKLRNLFDKLDDITYIVDPNSGTGEDEFNNAISHPDEDSDSEVEEVVTENNLSMCAILESHVDVSSLSSICSKDKVTKVPLWVKIHKVPVVAYSADGLSLIGTQIDDITYIVDPNSGTGEAEFNNAISHPDEDSDSEVEEVYADDIPTNTVIRGQALPRIAFPMFSMASWNIRGLNRTPKQSEVRQVVTENNLSMCVILESHVDVSSLSSICSKVFRNWDWISNVNLCNKGCRIILGWNKDIVDVLLLSQSDQVVNTRVFHKADNKVLYCSFIYAGNKTIERRTLWADLELHKYVVHGSPWSLWKPKGGDGMLKKLDRIMGNLGFVDNFPGAYAMFQPYRISDHSPAVLMMPSLSVIKPKPFKFYNFIVYKENFLEIVKSQWSKQVEGHVMYQITQKLKDLKKPLRKLLYEQGNLHDRVVRLRVELDEIQKAIDSDPSNSLLRDEEAVYIQDFNEAKIDEERSIMIMNGLFSIMSSSTKGDVLDLGRLSTNVTLSDSLNFKVSLFSTMYALDVCEYPKKMPL
uniref:DUF4283 domain-containing protein n=1 Tax=Tanacetum cinerariifolium TaxID=118510 RepID=A0A6L2LJX9_TANCI|nr:hypothetical protein [Tanacetum cinerariifolium]